MKYIEIPQLYSAKFKDAKLAQPNIEDIEEGSERHKLYLSAIELFIVGLDRVIAMDNAILRNLATEVKRVILDKSLELCLGNVPSLTMTVFGTSKGILPLVIAPEKWSEMFTKDEQYQIGGIIFVGSQIIDFFRGKLTSDFSERAKSYEAEYLKNLDPATFNEYQTEVLKKYPNGLDPKFIQNSMSNYELN